MKKTHRFQKYIFFFTKCKDDCLMTSRIKIMRRGAELLYIFGGFRLALKSGKLTACTCTRGRERELRACGKIPVTSARRKRPRIRKVAQLLFTLF